MLKKIKIYISLNKEYKTKDNIQAGVRLIKRLNSELNILTFEYMQSLKYFQLENKAVKYYANGLKPIEVVI